MEIFSSTDHFEKYPIPSPLPEKIKVHLRACVGRENRARVRSIRGKQYYCVGNILAIIGRPLFRHLRRFQSALMNSSGSERRYYCRFVFFFFISPPTYYLFGSIDVTAVVFYVRPIGSNQLFRQPGDASCSNAANTPTIVAARVFPCYRVIVHGTYTLPAIVERVTITTATHTHVLMN